MLLSLLLQQLCNILPFCILHYSNIMRFWLAAQRSGAAPWCVDKEMGNHRRAQVLHDWLWREKCLSFSISTPEWHVMYALSIDAALPSFALDIAAVCMHAFAFCASWHCELFTESRATWERQEKKLIIIQRAHKEHTYTISVEAAGWYLF